MPAADPKHPISFPFGALTDDEFDELVYLLAHTQDPAVDKLRAPDGGLDTVRPAEDDPLIAEWGIQAKLHRQHIKWSECKNSLDRAVEVWEARAVTFAFPRDLTQPQHKLFHKHLRNRHPDVKVDYWGASKLTALLLASPQGRGVAKRFFHTEDPADLADRAIRARGPLRTAEDLLERETVTGEFLRTADPHFDWTTTKRSRSPQPPHRTPGSVLRLEFAKDDEQFFADAVPRSPASLELAAPRGALAFPTREEWERAQELIADVQEYGGRAELGPTQVRLDQIPAPFDELCREPFDGRVLIRAHREVHPWAATVSASTDEGTASLDIDLTAEEPGDEWDVQLAGRRFGLTIELRFVWSHSERAGRLEFRWVFHRATGTAAERAQALALLIALHGTGTFEVRDREGQRPSLSEQTQPTPLADDLRHLHRIYEDLATIERFAGASFGPPPDEVTYEVAQQLAWLAQALATGSYDGTITSAQMRCGPDAVAGFRSGGNAIEIRQTLCAQFFGRELPVAEQVARLPLMVIKEAIRVPRPEALWDVVLIPATGDSGPVHFVLTPLDPQRERVAA